MNLSVVIVSHNPNRDWLLAAIDSARPVADQIVVVDNGSTERFPPMPLIVEHHTLNDHQGYAGGTNTAISAAAGDWICLLDDDDLLLPDAAVELKNWLASVHPRDLPDVVAFPILPFEHSAASAPLPPWGSPHSPATIFQTNTIPNSSWFKRDAWAAAGGFKLDVAGDWHFWATLTAQGCVFDWFEKPCLRKRMRKDSFSAKWPQTAPEFARTALAVRALAQPPGSDNIVIQLAQHLAGACAAPDPA